MRAALKYFPQGLSLCIGLSISLSGLPLAHATLGGPQVVEGEYLIKFKQSAGGISLVHSKLQNKAILKASFPGTGVFQVSLKSAMSVDELKNDPDVEYIEPNYIVRKGQTKTDEVLGYRTAEELVLANMVSDDLNTYSQSQANIGIEKAWSEQQPVSANRSTITVAVVDTGVDTEHHIFKPYNEGGSGALWVNEIEANGLPGIDDDRNGYVDDISGWNFASKNSNYIDDDNHGTHVAGIVVGAGLNIFSQQLEESKIKIMPLKFLTKDGSGTTAHAIQAIYYAVNNGAKVINNSWGGGGYSKALQDAIAYAYQHKVIVVSAAGNYASDNDQSPMYPANYDVPSNIAVAATTSSDIRASFSNYGAKSVHLGAPGQAITSSVTTIGGYSRFGTMSGTSMAAPLVAGLAALALREAPTLSGYQIKEIILGTSDKVTALENVVSTGSRVDAYELVMSAKNSFGSLSFQPGYSSIDRLPSSTTESAGGCGLVKSITQSGPGAGSGATPIAGILVGLMMIPLVVWQVMRMRSPAARRKYDRFRMNSEIKVRVGDRELTGSMSTISEGGLSFNTDEALEKGGIVTMRIQSPDGRETIEVQGQVVWSEQSKAYGVQFSETKMGARAMIRDWTSGLLKS